MDLVDYFYECPCEFPVIENEEDNDLKWICADFETSNSDKNIQEKYTRVWLWDIFDPENNSHINGYDIETFFDYLFKQKSHIIYFHNLKFDGSFIINYLLKNGFTIAKDKSNCTISTLITDKLVWYTFTVYFNGCRYVFRDSMKKIIGSLEEAAKSFDLEIRKGEIDYKKHRDKGYIPTAEEIDYIHIDTEIMGKILEIYYSQGMRSITNASDAMKAYKDIVTPHGYNNLFPILPKDVDDFIRRSYKGGFCYLNKKHFNNDLGKVYTYDVKSMYPSVMATADLPHGIPIHYFGKYEPDEDYPLFIQEINLNAKLKPNRIPSIQTKTFMSIKLKYLEDTEGLRQNMVLTHLDMIRLFEDYDIYDLEFVQGYKFMSSKSLFKEYVEHYYSLKEQSKGAKKQLYKIFLNSLYGKFAMMTERAQAYPEIEDGTNKWKKTSNEEVDAVYTAVASYITASARFKLLDGIYANLDNFVYCDTDSIHLLAPARGIKLGKQLGDFDLENGYYDENGDPVTYINKARYLGQKCYVLGSQKDEEVLIKKIAGAPKAVKESINWDNFRINFTSDASKFPKFRMLNVDGGILLVPTAFTIKDRN